MCIPVKRIKCDFSMDLGFCLCGFWLCVYVCVCLCGFSVFYVVSSAGNIEHKGVYKCFPGEVYRYMNTWRITGMRIWE
jgi:hypothetical protein